MGHISDPAVFMPAQQAGLARFVVCQVHGVPVEEMRKATRGRPTVARARQIAIHLAHKVFGLDRQQLAREFHRDPSTIQHACGLVAALRRDNPDFESTLRWMETMLRRAAGKDQP